ncbi:sigma 54-interacting transcriptional regulator [Oscillochloris sp. ZM17-4]|uniref:sigma-54-dependent Fis family transcriptional regulator n=1 Tax=Oscillochloris sp. ZM17-4 TaxID=2866714 RepID=UPI001C72F527|nr:sigma 54-interacting transcriptional regulator [Oscillochloris sp. ZM17-4]MBX0326517.1 sigma 54-interacting transcriptional regulator [Oscillochloris sp. ZM17-4]
MHTHHAPPIQRSWQRCVARGQRPEDGPAPAAAPGGPALRLLDLARSSIEDVYQLIEGPGFAIALADAQAVALHLEGDPAVVALARSCGLCPPADLSEERAGSNAVDLALREALPIQTVGVAHFSAQLRPLAIAAAPIFAVDGQPLGALAIITDAEGAHRHTLGLAIATAQALHNQLRADTLLADANDQLAELYAALETMSEGLIFIGPGNEIRRINSRAAEMLGVGARAVAGRPFAQALAMPEIVRQAIHDRIELVDQELRWQVRRAALAALGSVRPVWNHERRYLGALITIRPAQSVHQLVQRVVGAQAQFTFHDIIGQCPAMLQALHHAHMAAGGGGAVMLHGEPGVGKEIFAQAIHNASSRARGPFVRLNCAAVPRTVLASELFGVEGGPRPGDRPGRPGKLELAYGGLLYLEEVGVLPSELQTGLLRAIEMKRIIRTGGAQPLPIDVRIITTDADLERLTQEGRFRADLAARLSAFSVEIPPLRARGDDLLLLINHLLLLLSDRLGRQVAFAPDALQAMRAYPWPGNVRELELTIERVLHSSEKSVIGLEDLPPAIVHVAAPIETPESPSLNDSNRLSEREAILRAGHQTAGHLGRTAELLGISRATLWRKMGRYGISKADFWPSPHTP